MAIFAEVSDDECINKRQPLVKGDNMTRLRYNRKTVGCKLVLITNSKSHTGFRLVLT